ncbi:zinc finger protein 271-like [Cydia pomonella]|uniref:zinc finger protein 271-like n=1 Tax=Cydia pomonella TaxID=82600 RepID=UPI002ADE8B07|nr:zinc finger protein 271-like [Cydia pomonella]
MCHKTFKNKSYKHAHMLLHIRTKEFKCHVCEKKFTSESSLEKHLTVHNQVKCSVCEKELKTQANLARHMLVHTGERPFPCSFCSRRFTQKSVLIKHERIHTGEMPYECEMCLKKFSRSFTLENHLKRIHRKEKVENIKNGMTSSKKKKSDPKKENSESEKEKSPAETPECDMKRFWCVNCDNLYNNKEFYIHECAQINKFEINDVCGNNVPEIDYSDHEDNESSQSPFLDVKEEVTIKQTGPDNINDQFKHEIFFDTLPTNIADIEANNSTINTDTDILIDNEKKYQPIESNEKKAKVRKKMDM